jgi:hypothetical protein
VGAQPGLGLLNADFKNKMPHCATVLTVHRV